MPLDIVMPQGNEDLLIKRALVLGITEMVFVYEDKKELSKSVDSEGMIIHKALVVDTKTQNSKHASLYFSRGLRQHFEDRKVKYLYELEEQHHKDNYHYKYSGLNHILAKLAADKGKTIVFSFRSVLKARYPDKILGKMMQNARLCRKYKTKVIVASMARKPHEMRNPSDLKAVGRVIGLDC